MAPAITMLKHQNIILNPGESLYISAPRKCGKSTSIANIIRHTSKSINLNKIYLFHKTEKGKKKYQKLLPDFRNEMIYVWWHDKDMDESIKNIIKELNKKEETSILIFDTMYFNKHYFYKDTLNPIHEYFVRRKNIYANSCSDIMFVSDSQVRRKKDINDHTYACLHAHAVGYYVEMQDDLNIMKRVRQLTIYRKIYKAGAMETIPDYDIEDKCPKVTKFTFICGTSKMFPFCYNTEKFKMDLLYNKLISFDIEVAEVKPLVIEI